MPWLRPMVGVILYSKARFFSAASSASTSAIRMIGGARQLNIQAGVQHVGRRHALMNKARFRSHDLRQVGQEGDDVMLDLALDLVDPRHVEFGVAAFLPDLFRGLLRDHAQFGQGIGGVRLDLEPDAEFGLGRPDGHHRARA